MIVRELKLKLTKKQESILNEWLWILTGVWNWAVRKIELDAKDGIYYSQYGFEALVVGHGKRIGVPSVVMEATLRIVYRSWRQCFKGVLRKPRLKGQRNKLNSVHFKSRIKPPANNRIKLPLLGSVKFHKQELPPGTIKCGQAVRRASGWYLCLFIDTEPNAIPKTSDGEIGIDPGFKDLLTLSTGEKIAHPREYEALEKRIGQAQRGKNKRLVARLHERIKNQRKDRNHKLSRCLVAENKLIVFSKDNQRGMAKRFGKSVTSSTHYQLRQMLSYKCRAGGREYVEVDSKYSTKTCSACGCLSGPAGLAGLKVRQWVCKECGSSHDRDINAAINTLIAGVGATHEVIA